MQYRPMDWDDLRFVLAVARAGSALRAAERLAVNQTTVLRRLSGIECALATALFERRRSGLTLTGAGRRVVEGAERVEQEVEALQAALAAQQRTLAGSVRFTTSETLAARLVTPCLREFHRRHPAVTVELIVADRALDLARGEADVALRAGLSPEGAGIVARRLPDNDWTIYCSRTYAAERGVPDSREAIAGHDILGMEGQMAQLPGAIWLLASAPDAVIRFRSNSLTNLLFNIKAGLGLGALPCMLGDNEPELVRCLPPPPELRGKMWLIVREAVKAQPPVRAFTDFLAGYIRQTLGTPSPVG